MKAKRSEHVNNVIVVSDTHCGDQGGLCPPEGVVLDDGGPYQPSPLQKVVWKWWEEFWGGWVPHVTQGEPYAVVVNGDAIDHRHHGATHQISQNLSTQSRIATAVFLPIVKLCEGRFYLVRGTEAHSGPSSEAEEQLGEKLGAIPDEVGRYARPELRLLIGGKARAHIMHHIGTTGTSHYESTAVMKELMESYVEAGRWGRHSYDAVVRCLSADTELLTRNGWLGIDAVGVATEVMTLDTFSGVMEWQLVQQKVVNEAEPEMIRFTGKGMDISVSPDHNMAVRTNGRWGPTGWQPVSANDLFEWFGERGRRGYRIEIPVAGHYPGSPVPLTQDELWFLGFFMADGSFVRKPDGRRYAMRVHQADERASEVEARLASIGVESPKRTKNAEAGTPHFDHRKFRWVYTRRNCSTWYIPNGVAVRLIEFLNDDKSLVPLLMDMATIQFQALIEGFAYGDGSKSANKLFNTNERILDQLQELMVKHGYKSSLRYNDYYTTKRGERKRMGVLNYIPDCTSIGIGQKRRGQTIFREPYGDRSWCVTVPNHTLVIRRNGCVAIVGNSHRHRGLMITIPSANNYAFSIVTPGWQLKTPFAYRIPGGRLTTPQFGGTLLRQGDEEFFTRHWVRSIEPPKEEAL